MIDSGASISFIRQDLAQLHEFPTSHKPLDIALADGAIHTTKSATRLVLQTSPIHFEVQTFQLIPLGNYPIILGMDWLAKHNPIIDWSTGTISFPCTASHQLSSLDGTALATMPVTIPPFLPVPSPKKPKKSKKSKKPKSKKPEPQKPKSMTPPLLSSLIDISVVSPSSFSQMVRQNHDSAYLLDVAEIETLCSAEVEIQNPESPTLPSKYAEFEPIFSKVEADHLPPHRPYDHTIPVVEGGKVPFGPVYNLSQVELKALHEYIKENLAKGFIRRSESPAGAPILFVKKKDGSLRLCVDYRGLNKVTIPNKCPLPRPDETFDRLAHAKRFTKLDMRGAYNLLRIAKGEEWKTAFRCRYGHFEYQVMPFGLMNAPGTFQAFVNDVLREYLDVFVVVYLDDILIFSENPDDHDDHVRLVLSKLKEHKLSLKLEKCEFDKTSVSFLGFVVGVDGIAMDPAKVAAIQEWATPKSAFDIQVFLGLANFYRRFVKNYSKIATPLTSLLKKASKFIWSKNAQAAFDKLKASLASGPILCHFNPAKPCVVEADASDYALGMVCSQYDDEGRLHPIAFYSRKLLPAEMNYQIYDKELLAIVVAFKHWRHYLEFSSETTVVLSDHRNLEYFSTTRNLSRRQVRWSEILSDFNFVIRYRPGSQNAAADALSRRDKPEGGSSPLASKTSMILLPATQFLGNLLSLPLVPESLPIQSLIKDNIQDDPTYGPTFKKTAQDPTHDPLYQVQDGFLLRDGLLCVPDIPDLKKMILEECHDSISAGHFGIAKTFELVSRTFYWPSMRKYVKDYVTGCDTCQRNKNNPHKPYGLLQPLPVPAHPWRSISVDFTTQLPASGQYTAICVFVDRFTKMAHFAPTTNEVDAVGTVQLFLERVFASHGLPDDIVSDRGVTFIAQFTQEVFKALNIKQNLSTAYHPQTDGQTERVNSTLEQFLRCYINYQQSNWSTLLPLAEFAYNNTYQATIKTTPFFANLGFNPKFTVSLPGLTKNSVRSTDYIQAFKDLHANLKFNIEEALETHAKYYDAKVKQQPALKIGDKVWLDTKNIKTDRPAKKLDYKKLGPFKILAQVGTRSFRLDLPKSVKIHPVFHVNLLEPWRPDHIPGRKQNPPPPVQVKSDLEYEVKKILDSRLKKGKLEYLIDWVGYEPQDRTWEPAIDVANAPDLVQEFHTENPTKPGPLLHGVQP